MKNLASTPFFFSRLIILSALEQQKFKKKDNKVTEQSAAQILWRMVEGCLSLETSLGEKHSGMSISLKKRFQQSFSANKKWILVDESKKSPSVYGQCPGKKGE